MTSLQNQSPTWQELPAYLSLSFWGHEHMEQDSNIVTVRPRKDKEHSLTYMPAYQELGELNPPPKGLLTTNRASKHLPGTPGHDPPVRLPRSYHAGFTYYRQSSNRQKHQPDTEIQKSDAWASYPMLGTLRLNGG